MSCSLICFSRKPVGLEVSTLWPITLSAYQHDITINSAMYMYIYSTHIYIYIRHVHAVTRESIAKTPFFSKLVFTSRSFTSFKKSFFLSEKFFWETRIQTTSKNAVNWFTGWSWNLAPFFIGAMGNVRSRILQPICSSDIAPLVRYGSQPPDKHQANVRSQLVNGMHA